MLIPRADFQGSDHGENVVLDIKLDTLKIELTSLDLGEVQDVVEKAKQGIRRAAYDFQIGTLWRAELRIKHQLGHANYGVHGRSDFTAHIGQKLAFGAVGRLCRLLSNLQLRQDAFLSSESRAAAISSCFCFVMSSR